MLADGLPTPILLIDIVNPRSADGAEIITPAPDGFRQGAELWLDSDKLAQDRP
jgi:hypothetical protein